MGSDSATPTIRETKAKQYHAPLHIPVTTAGVSIQKSDVKQVTNLKMTLRLPTPVKADKLNDQLQGYDEGLKQYLVKCFRYGFSLGCIFTPNASLSTHHSSALNHQDIIQSYKQISWNWVGLQDPI